MGETTSLQPKPLLAAKVASSVKTTINEPVKLSTSKAWVLPPRPKPGRKPSADTPSSKRKAQNRAAQRAFRERRAALVSELEEKLADIEQERNKKDVKMEHTIMALHRENEDLKNQIAHLKAQMEQPDALRKAGRNGSELTMDDWDRALEQKLPVPDKRCDICIKDDCLCEHIGIRPKQERESAPKRDSLTIEEREIDFTATFSRPKKKSKHDQSQIPSLSVSLNEQISSTGADKCGFCADGTPCVCAEAAADESKQQELENSSILPPIRALSLPSIAEHSESPPLGGSRRPSNSRTGCTGNPGTCYQCQNDPMSTLFCTTLASRDRTMDSNGEKQHRRPSTQLNTAEPGQFIPCAAAYKTISRHRDFRNADFGNMISKLRTRGMEVEVNSVARVLRELDKRLYD